MEGFDARRYLTPGGKGIMGEKQVKSYSFGTAANGRTEARRLNTAGNHIS